MMIRMRKGLVREILSRDDTVTYVRVEYDGIISSAVNYNMITGEINVNDIVYINTSAVFLNLGSGGYDFVVVNKSRGSSINIDGEAPLMKLRYTPYQVKCTYPDNMDSIERFKNLDGLSFLAGELHSMLLPCACCLKYIKKNASIAYIMTDGGCLPIYYSHSVKKLKELGVISWSVTCGNSFGGDYEAVNIFDALIISKEILHCDFAIITMGPGIAGTGTKYGFSGIEQGFVVDSIDTLGGKPVVIPRISFADSRSRHYGISHHTLTVLSTIIRSRAYAVFPETEPSKMEFIKKQIEENNIHNKHYISFEDGSIVFEALKYYGLKGDFMGRDQYADRDFFLSCGAAAHFVSKLL